MQSIRLYFPIFSVNQLLSPVVGEFRQARDKLLMFNTKLLYMLPKNARVPSEKLPVGVYIKFFTTKDHYQVENFCFIAYQIVKVLGHATIIQDTNLSCVWGVAYDVEIIEKQCEEGCEISFVENP